MPKSWLYYLALLTPLVFGVLVAHTGFIEWLWYQGYEDEYFFLSKLKVDPRFGELVGGWTMLFFVITVWCYWQIDGDEETMPRQFLLLPIAYGPFAAIGNVLLTQSVVVSVLWGYPLIALSFGYLYIFPWVITIWLFAKLRIVL